MHLIAEIDDEAFFSLKFMKLDFIPESVFRVQEPDELKRHFDESTRRDLVQVDQHENHESTPEKVETQSTVLEEKTEVNTQIKNDADAECDLAEKETIKRRISAMRKGEVKDTIKEDVLIKSSSQNSNDQPVADSCERKKNYRNRGGSRKHRGKPRIRDGDDHYR